jgi:hypothetical protein
MLMLVSWMNRQKMTVSNTTRYCNTCKETKDLDCFGGYGVNKQYYKASCKVCEAKNTYLRRTLERENPRPVDISCAICGKTEKDVLERGRRLNQAFVLDHCHETGKFRAWLCSGCNKSLGYMEDNPLIALQAASYLIEHK